MERMKKLLADAGRVLAHEARAITSPVTSRSVTPTILTCS
jgi:hypothetical protein